MAQNLLRYYEPAPKLEAPETVEVDVCVYGGTSGGIATAVQAARLGKTVALVAFGRHLGGMTSGGLGRTDVGNAGAFGGIAREFYRRVGAKYGIDIGWTFEPKVASAVFREMLEEAKVPVYTQHCLESVEMDGARLVALTCENGRTFKAKVFVDAGYDGDLMAAAGVSYTVGREGNEPYGEIYNGRHFGHPNHNFKAFVDPYREPGKPSSGLLPGVMDEEPGAQGEGDDCVQAYNFRLCLTRAEDRLAFPKPEGYEPERYELLARYIAAGVFDPLTLTAWMPNGKTDTNNYGAFSSDNIGRNHDWPEATYAEREKIYQDHVAYNQGLYRFLCHDERVPEKIRAWTARWGLPADEFTETGGWPPELYVREARRMVSDLVVTEHHCIKGVEEEDAVALAAYQIDSHNCRRIVYGGRAFNEGNVEIPVPSPYGLSYRALVPPKKECTNLLVPWCVSATHTAFGSIRMEPVFMAIGHACADAAALAIDGGTAVQDVDYARLRAQLLEEDQRLSWPQPDGEHLENPGRLYDPKIDD